MLSPTQATRVFSAPGRRSSRAISSRASMGGSLREQVFVEEQGRRGAEVVAVFLPGEAVAFVVGVDRPHRAALGADLGGDLLGLGEGDARVVAAVADQQGRADLLRVAGGRNALEHLAHLRVA